MRMVSQGSSDLSRRQLLAAFVPASASLSNSSSLPVPGLKSLKPLLQPNPGLLRYVSHTGASILVKVARGKAALVDAQRGAQIMRLFARHIEETAINDYIALSVVKSSGLPDPKSGNSKGLKAALDILHAHDPSIPDEFMAQGIFSRDDLIQTGKILASQRLPSHLRVTASLLETSGFEAQNEAAGTFFPKARSARAPVFDVRNGGLTTHVHLADGVYHPEMHTMLSPVSYCKASKPKNTCSVNKSSTAAISAWLNAFDTKNEFQSDPSCGNGEDPSPWGNTAQDCADWSNMQTNVNNAESALGSGDTGPALAIIAQMQKCMKC